MDYEALQAHWQRVYTGKDPSLLTWFQATPAPSLDLVEWSGIGPDDPVIDIGGGASTFVDALLARGFRDVTVLDVSSAALAAAKDRLGERTDLVAWICEDVTAWLPDRAYRFWHDRAVFHFLTDPVERALYAATLYDVLDPGGWAAIGTFAPDGPDRCSGLEVCRHDAQSILTEIGPAFEIVHERRHVHVSPKGIEQKYAWSLFRKR